MDPVIFPGIVTGDVPVSHWLIPGKRPRSLCES